MTITFDNVNTVLTGTVTSAVITLNVASGDNRMIIISTADEGTMQTISSIDSETTGVGVKVDSQAVGSGTTEQNVEMWRIMESDIVTGTNTITINFSGSVVGAGISAMSLSGVAQQAAEAKVTTSGTTITTISQDITTLTNDAIIISIVGSGADHTFTHGTGQIERWDFQPTSASFSGTTEIKASAGIDNQSHTASTESFRMAMVTAAFAESITSISKIQGINTIQGVQSITL